MEKRKEEKVRRIKNYTKSKKQGRKHRCKKSDFYLAMKVEHFLS